MDTHKNETWIFDLPSFEHRAGGGIAPVEAGALKYNARVKLYPSGDVQLLVSDRSIFRPEGWEEISPAKPEESPEVSEPEALDPEASRDRAQRRARAAIKDYALSNPFTHFITLTLDPQKIDRYDEKLIIKKLSTWLDNRVRRNHLMYVVVPEHHKDGAIHFHGLIGSSCMSAEALTLIDSGALSVPGQKRPVKPRSGSKYRELLEKGAHPIYNLKQWKWGFSSAIPLYGDYNAAVGYVAKYIGKEADKIGGRWYYSGGGLNKPAVRVARLDFEKAAGFPGSGRFEIEELGCSAAALYIHKEDLEDVFRTLVNP